MLAEGAEELMATLVYGQFGPMVPAGTIDALLAQNNLASQIGTGLDASTLVAYRFTSDKVWTQRTSADGTGDVDHLDSSGVLGAALRRVYAAAAGLSTWSPTESAIAQLTSPLGAKLADTGGAAWTPAARVIAGGIALAGAGAGAFHGYRRNRGSIGWALAWAALGGLFPLVTTGVAIAQGFGKPARSA
jgi:hypothetical protein